ncbi:TOTE conflict system archaeo-eukaryotic primase domain-containing protein [Acidovorax sp.]|uniref:TOTE conflict system archaeo-eukaryotic primase domain-containing protein n=1 Tax=Acidovorax sp. TaxID=1872122 RepID=UPI00391FA77C
MQESELSRLSTAEKVALLRRLFRGRTDAYPIRWEGKTSGKSGYAPACINEWRAGVCENHPPPALQAGVDAQIAQAEALSTHPKTAVDRLYSWRTPHGLEPWAVFAASPLG